MATTRAVTPFILTTMTAAAIGCVSIVLATPVPTPSGLAPGQGPRTVEVTSQSFIDERTVEVTLHIDADQELTTQAAGTVTASACAPGIRIRSGQRVLRIDDRPVLGLHTAVPLYRSLQPGDQGRDVRALQVELRRLGYRLGVDGRYRGSTASAVKGLLNSAGAVQPSGRLDLADVVWLASAAVNPATCPAQPGKAISAGDPIATVRGKLTAVSYPIPDQLHPGERSLTLFGVRSASASATGEVTDDRFLTAVARTKAYLVARGDPDGQRPTGSLALTTPIAAVKVPPTALTDIDGQHGCVEQDGARIEVDIIGSGLGAALIRPVDPRVQLTRVSLSAGSPASSCGASPRPARTP
jgi:peptidoglycan hydrolase-like protein with peptidoglycan-binding domain